jgi:ligand-binding sensor domain-containing protein
MYEDRKGNLWFAESHGLWRWNELQPIFYPLGNDQNVRALSEDADPGLLVIQQGRVDRLEDGKQQEAYRLPGAVGLTAMNNTFRDRDGAIWMGSAGEGLVHLHNGRVDQFS